MVQDPAKDVFKRKDVQQQIKNFFTAKIKNRAEKLGEKHNLTENEHV